MTENVEQHVHVHVHFDPLRVELSGKVEVIVKQPSQRGRGVRTVLSIGGTGVPITVDTTNSTVTLTDEDDHGDVVAIPAGSKANFTSSNPTVLSVGTETLATGKITAPLVPHVVGSASISASPTAATGGPFTKATGGAYTPPAAASVTVGAGPGEQFVLSVAT